LSETGFAALSRRHSGAPPISALAEIGTILPKSAKADFGAASPESPIGVDVKTHCLWLWIPGYLVEPVIDRPKAGPVGSVAGMTECC
jgi:hypothetical protein